jgi:dipeptidyl aminopeptidase/acylaminoacyl peptidase
MYRKILFLSLCLSFFAGMLLAQVNLTYQLPPKRLVDIVDAPTTPDVTIDPTQQSILYMDRSDMPTIVDLSKEELRLGGIRVDPRSNGPSRSSYFISLSVSNIHGNARVPIEGLPSSPIITNVSWSPDGQHIAFTLTTDTGIELWIASIQTKIATRYSNAVVNNAFFGRPYTWLPDSRTLVYKEVVEGRGEHPVRSTVPEGPVIQETKGKIAAVPTYQDLISDRYDEAIFEYYTTSQLVMITLDKNKTKIGAPAMIIGFDPSPDGNYLLVEQLKKPFSYQVPYYLFPQTAEIWDVQGHLVRLLGDIPLSDDIPKGFDAVRKGPRNFQWRADAPATIYWVEAMDEGDPAKQSTMRDQLFFMKAPFQGEPSAGIQFTYRAGYILWGNDRLAIATEGWEKTRKELVSFFSPEGNPATKRVIFDLSSEDRYKDPGSFQLVPDKNGQRVLLFGNKGKTLYLTGAGASPEGDRPFLDEYDIASGKTKRLWRSEAPYYEMVVLPLDMAKGLVITSRQSVQEPPNYYLRNLINNNLVPITRFEHPYPQFRDIQKELVTYEREDGVKLSFELYLPAGYKKSDGSLPTLLWAYPREYKSADAAGQVQASPYTFARISPSSAIIFALEGYAVLNNVAFPIIGEGDTEPNDTFVEQLVANAKAAIDKAVEMGVTDRNKIAVGGHSYGAFMTANLLAHCDLFAAGIARSGAYNRTLTPFGFQAEPRTYWEAPETYYVMSPFSFANKIKTPLLLLHGLADNNSGTFPIQSERLYQAIKGHGGTARLVFLPFESHGYVARESILHMLWEMDRWLDMYVKNRE